MGFRGGKAATPSPWRTVLAQRGHDLAKTSRKCALHPPPAPCAQCMRHVPARAHGCIASGFGIGCVACDDVLAVTLRGRRRRCLLHFCAKSPEMQKALRPASWVQFPSAFGVVSAGRREGGFGNNGSSHTRLLAAASAFGSSAEGGGYSGFGRGRSVWHRPRASLVSGRASESVRRGRVLPARRSNAPE